ncbi:MAG: SDR family oxidoreductase [Chitinophagaceae bacterium]
MEQNVKYALVTGATSGIGFELAKLLAQDKYNLIIAGREQMSLDQTANELSKYNIEVVTIVKDLFDHDSPFQLYQEVKEKGIEIDVLINDAGQGQYGEFVDTDIDREIDIIQLNIISLVVLTKHFLRDMVSRGSGKILNVASVASKIPGPYQSVYHGTKAFVHSFTEAIRSEVKDSGITVTSLLPGVTDTDFFNKADMEDSKVVKEGKKAEPADVAKNGYDALMNDKDMVVSGFMNKVQVAISNVTPDSMVADKIKKQQAPADESK